MQSKSQSTRNLLPLLIVIASSLTACDKNSQPQNDPPALTGPAEFAGSSACSGCHAEQFESWQGSHHQLAMQPATDETVLGNFEDTRFDYFSIASRFFRKDGEFHVESDNASGELQEFVVRYAFGITPLQQYLVEFPNGHLQTLPIAWDSRPQEEGGQRWFHLYPDEFIDHNNPLHWTGRDQNWNFMCAECHSTNLQKNYELSSDTFDTTWSEISVGCEACHGPSSRHIELAESGFPDGENGLLVNLDDSENAAWVINPATGIAERSELRMSPQQQPEACGRCHSRRSISASEYAYDSPLMDTHRVATLDERLYFADGQIEDEVYVYGSFVQSKMYRAGVTCSDCHEPHSATLRTTGAVSEVCSTCHLPSKFATEEHHRHATDQVECVDCHMPSRDYMVIDGRRDHSFRIPRPDLTIATGSPNACVNCHEDRDAKWTQGAMSAWYGDEQSEHYALALHAGRNGSPDANRHLTNAATNPDYPGIARATALSLLRSPYSQEATDAVRSSLSDGDAMVRIAALQALQALPPEIQVEWAMPRLQDTVRSVRIAAVDVLSPLRDSIPAPIQNSFRAAEREFIDAQLAIAERPEALGNLGNLFAEEGNAERAVQFYLVALQKEPRSAAIRVNLSDLYRRLQQDEQAEELLRQGLQYPGQYPENLAAIRHTLGLLLVRQQRLDEALAEIQQSVQLDPDNPRYVYVYAIALNSLQQTDQAVITMQQASQRFAGDFDIAWTLVTMLRDAGRMDEAQQAAEALLQRFPDNESAQGLVESLR